MSAGKQWLNLSLDKVERAAADRVRAFRMLMMGGTRLRGLMPSNIGPWTEHHAPPKPAPRSLHELARDHLGDE